MSRVTAEFPIVTEDEFPTGLRCIECSRVLPSGTPYAEQVLRPGDLEAEPETLEEHWAAAGVVRLICVYCGLETA